MYHGKNYAIISLYVDFVCVCWFFMRQSYTGLKLQLLKYQYMNVRLEKLFLQYNLSYKDCHEISQIYQFLPDHKRQNLIDNFETIVANINNLRQKIGMEQEVLLWEALTNIEKKVSHIKKKQVLKSTADTISDLKKMI